MKYKFLKNWQIGKLVVFAIAAHFLHFSSLNGQITVELNAVAGKPFGVFSDNINRDAFFGMHIGVLYSLKKKDHLSFGLQFQNMPYDESTLSDLNIEDNLFIRQRFKTNISYQSMHGIIRLDLNKENNLVHLYVDGLIGFNRFMGRTRSENAFFTGDTNNDGTIDDFDGEIDLEKLGITTSVELAKSESKLNHVSISPSFGLGVGLKLKLINNLRFNSRFAYIYGTNTTYYDYGSQEISTNSIDNFALVESATPILFWTAGLSYSF